MQEKEEHNITKAKLLEISKKTENVDEETNLLIQERDLLKEKVNDERSRNSVLEKQLADKQNKFIALQKRQV